MSLNLTKKGGGRGKEEKKKCISTPRKVLQTGRVSKPREADIKSVTIVARASPVDARRVADHESASTSRPRLLLFYHITFISLALTSTRPKLNLHPESYADLLVY